MASLLERLKERKLFQWALAYLAGAWLVLQLVEVLGQIFQWSLALQQGITVVLAVGFLLTLVLAWYHGEKGRQRASGAELLMIAALLAIAAILLTIVRPREEAATISEPVLAVEGAKPAIAVLPFDNFSPDPDDAYFADGMHEELNAQLARISGLKVISRTSVMQYREARPPVREIAAALGVDFILEGSARLAEERVRLAVQLIDARGDEHIWADQYDRDLTADHLFAIQTAVAEEVAAALEVELLPADRYRIERQPTENLEAYELYLLGRSAFRGRYPGGSEPILRSIGYFERAIEADSAYSLAFSGLAEAQISLLYFGPGGRVELEEATRAAEWAAQKAVAFDSSSAEAWSALAAVHIHGDRDWERAERLLHRAIELNPGNYDALGWLDDVLKFTRRYEEAVAVSARALALDPLYMIAQVEYASSLWGAGRLDEAAEQFARTTRAGHREWAERKFSNRPEGWVALSPMVFNEILVYHEMGLSYAEAFQTLIQTLRKTNATTEEIDAYERRWRGLDWELLWAATLEVPSARAIDRAVALTRLGRKEEAVRELRRAHDIGEAGLPWYHANPYFRTLQDYSGYVELMEELGLRP